VEEVEKAVAGASAARLQQAAPPLLEALRALPAVLNVDTPIRVPQRGRRRIGSIVGALMRRLMQLLPPDGGQTSPECWETALPLRHAYALLAWRNSGEQPVGDPAREALQWATLRARLQLAEAGQWGTLVGALLEATGEKQRMRCEWAMQGAEDASAEAMRWKQRGAAIAKVHLDCTRTATQMLRGQSGMAPCEATAVAQAAQLATQPLAEAECEDLTTALRDAETAYWGSGGGPGAQAAGGAAHGRPAGGCKLT